MLKPLKVRCINYKMILAPLIILGLYILFEFLSLNLIFGDSSYKKMHLLFAVFFLSMAMLFLGKLFGGKFTFVTNLIYCSVVLYLSFIIVAVFYYFKLNFGGINYCKNDFDIKVVANMYTLTILVTFIISVIYFYLINYLKIKFKLTEFLIFFIIFMVFQFFATKGFRQF